MSCMVKLQGYTREEILPTVFSEPYRESDQEALVAYIASQSNGMQFDLKLEHPREKKAAAIGEAIFYRRAGTMDFSCATCHVGENKRIRLQALMNINKPKQVQEVMGSWPTYRVSQGTVRTMQHRIWDCHWQMRLPDIEYGSDASVALITYLSSRANGGVINVPAIKR